MMDKRAPIRVLLFNLATDVDDPILGFTTRWIGALAERVEFIHVISMRVGRIEVPQNVRVYSVGKEKGYSEPRRVVEFYQHLFRVLRCDRIDICFSHMIPAFSLLAAPVLKVRRIPLITWYAHRQLSTVLKLAHYSSDRMVSINEESYPYRRNKFVALGHGVDTELFAPNGGVHESRPLLLSVGRLSPIKDLMTLIDAIYLLQQKGYEVDCALVGNSPARDSAYEEIIRERVRHLGLGSSVSFIGPVPNAKVISWYRKCLAHVNCSPADHSIDKAPLEAMACGKLSLSSTLAFRETMGKYADLLLFQHRSPNDLARKVERLLSLSQNEVRAMGFELRQRVVDQHNLQKLCDHLTALFSQLR